MNRGVRWPPGKIRAAFFLWGWLWLAACGARPTPLPSAQELLTQSANAMLALKAAHFVVERSGAPAYVDSGNTLIFRRAEGDFVAPDQARASVRVIGPGAVVEVQVVALGDRYWETNPVTGAWTDYSAWGYNPAVLFSAQSGIAVVMQRHLSNLKLLGLEALADRPGEQFFHLSAEAPGEPVQTMTAGLVGRGRVQFEWWMEPAAGHVVRLRVVEPETDPQDPTVWVVDFDAFDQPLTLAPPAP